MAKVKDDRPGYVDGYPAGVAAAKARKAEAAKTAPKAKKTPKK